MVVSRCDGAVDLEVAEDAFDAVALPVETFVITDHDFSVRLRWGHGSDATFLESGPDSVGVVGYPLVRPATNPSIHAILFPSDRHDSKLRVSNPQS